MKNYGSRRIGACWPESAGEASFKAFVGPEADSIRNIHGVAGVAELDGDEVGYLVGRGAEIKGIS